MRSAGWCAPASRCCRKACCCAASTTIAAVLEALFRGLVAMRVKPYYLHHPDLARGTGHFRLGIEEGRRLVACVARPRLRAVPADLRARHSRRPRQGADRPERRATAGPAPEEWIVEDPAGRRHRYPPRRPKTGLTGPRIAGGQTVSTMIIVGGDALALSTARELSLLPGHRVVVLWPADLEFAAAVEAVGARFIAGRPDSRDWPRNGRGRRGGRRFWPCRTTTSSICSRRCGRATPTRTSASCCANSTARLPPRSSRTCRIARCCRWPGIRPRPTPRRRSTRPASAVCSFPSRTDPERLCDPRRGGPRQRPACGARPSRRSARVLSRSTARPRSRRDDVVPAGARACRLRQRWTGCSNRRRAGQSAADAALDRQRLRRCAAGGAHGRRTGSTPT